MAEAQGIDATEFVAAQLTAIGTGEQMGDLLGSTTATFDALELHRAWSLAAAALVAAAESALHAPRREFVEAALKALAAHRTGLTGDDLR